jgi:rhomboid family GlyGly-CTERM serine protease
MVTVYAWLGPAPATWVYDRVALAHGELWRGLTAHWIHGDNGHLLWNLLGGAVLGALVEQGGRRRLLLALLAGMLAVDAGLGWGLPELQRYCGLSGVLNALMLVALADLWTASRSPWVLGVAAALAMKLTAETLLDRALLTHTLWPSVPWVHVAGMLGGAVFLFVDDVSARFRRMMRV